MLTCHLSKYDYIERTIDSLDNSRTWNRFELFATNFQSIEARQLFPCWDEPAFKTTFEIYLSFDTSYFLWPSMEVRKNWEYSYITDENIHMFVKLAIKLNATSTYNVAFAITDLYPKLYDVNKHRSIECRRRPCKYMSLAQEVIDRTLQSTWYKNVSLGASEVSQLAIPLTQHSIIGGWRLIVYKYVNKINIIFYLILP